VRWRPRDVRPRCLRGLRGARLRRQPARLRQHGSCGAGGSWSSRAGFGLRLQQLCELWAASCAGRVCCCCCCWWAAGAPACCARRCRGLGRRRRCWGLPGVCCRAWAGVQQLAALEQSTLRPEERSQKRRSAHTDQSFLALHLGVYIGIAAGPTRPPALRRRPPRLGLLTDLRRVQCAAAPSVGAGGGRGQPSAVAWQEENQQPVMRRRVRQCAQRERVRRVPGGGGACRTVRRCCRHEIHLAADRVADPCLSPSHALAAPALLQDKALAGGRFSSAWWRRVRRQLPPRPQRQAPGD
jgi:hypothetical protein